MNMNILSNMFLLNCKALSKQNEERCNPSPYLTNVCITMSYIHNLSA